MKYMSITKRWILNVASIFIALVTAASVFLFIMVHNYYYGAARMAVQVMTPEELGSTFDLYGASVTGFETAARDYCENFASKDTLAVWVINKYGRVIVTSSGFAIEDDVEMPDFTQASSEPGGTALWTGRLPSGEKIMANTCAYYDTDGEFGGAIRYMVSMKAIDRQLIRIALMIAAVVILMITAIMMSGMSFVRGIVNPVKEIGKTAKRIAGGDLKASIDHYPFNDEIGELCTTINDMADKLAESDRLKNDFISTVSHELRTPLTAIKGWGETLIQMEGDPEMIKRGMEIIVSESSRLNDMVEELLDFSRISSGRMKYNISRIDFLAELDDVVYSFRDRTSRTGIEMEYSAPDVPAIGEGDASRIKQVFINILDNAIKYTGQGGRITVKAAITADNNLVVTVSDTGVGIAAEDLPHIKEKFYKANNTVRGSGIGLAVCDEIMRYHGGTLELSSVYGEGTTVIIELPLEESAKEEEQYE